jgi:hypothetical protein
MAETKITYELWQDSGLGFYKVQDAASEIAAKTIAQQRQSNIDEAYEIRSVVTTVSTLDSFFVPAHVKTIDEIAQEIIDGSDGSFNVEWGEDYSALPLYKQAQVEEIVWQEIASCDGCGWHFHVDNLEQHIASGDCLCWHCANDREEENEG